jgi:hypothetical protein
VWSPVTPGIFGRTAATDLFAPVLTVMEDQVSDLIFGRMPEPKESGLGQKIRKMIITII